MKIVLLGFMCAGKTKVGRLLAKRLGWAHYDTDAIIEKKAGASIANIIIKHGEDIFRDIEKQTVFEVCKNDNCVISTGGGVPLDPDNMKQLQEMSLTFWLKVSPKIVLRRVGDVSKRPLLDKKKPFDSICDLLQKRRPFYEVANFTVDTDTLSPHEVADQVYSRLPAHNK